MTLRQIDSKEVEIREERLWKKISAPKSSKFWIFNRIIKWPMLNPSIRQVDTEQIWSIIYDIEVDESNLRSRSKEFSSRINKLKKLVLRKRCEGRMWSWHGRCVKTLNRLYKTAKLLTGASCDKASSKIHRKTDFKANDWSWKIWSLNWMPHF